MASEKSTRVRALATAARRVERALRAERKRLERVLARLDKRIARAAATAARQAERVQATKRKPKKSKAKPRKASAHRLTFTSTKAGGEGQLAAQRRALVLDAVKRSPGGVGRHYLADVRDRLMGVAREDQDRALRELQDDGVIVLMRNDNTREVSKRDEHAALYFGGNPRHLVYLA